MKLELKKIGTTLSSRPAGKEALSALMPTLRSLKENEILEIDFSEIYSLSPSWADEFLTPLRDRFGDRLVLLPSDNLSVTETVKFLEEIGGKRFNKKSE